MEYSSNSAIKFVVQKRMSRKIKWYLIIGLVLWIGCVGMDLWKEPKIEFYGWVESVLKERSENLCETVKNAKYLLAGSLQEFSGIVVTLDTILAAAVIFFYSVQDNEKEGIPNRTIMAYSCGSFTVPVLFVITMVLIPVNQCAITLHLTWTSWMGLIISYMMQMVIVILILLSTSYQYSVFIIGNAEIRQFQILNTIEEEKEKQNGRKAEAAVQKVHAKQNPFFVWTYLLHHLEQVVLSNELIADKMELTRRLLRVPFYPEEIKLDWKRIFSFFGAEEKQKRIDNPELSVAAMKKNSLKGIYQFYYGSLAAILQRMDDGQMEAERNTIYLVLYEFMEELTEVYEKVRGEEGNDGTEYQNYYMMSICGIINAVMDSGVDDAEGFCSYVFNNIVSEHIWNIQFSLYVLFQEYLYRTNKEAIKLEHLENMKGLGEWQVSEKEQEIYIDFWKVWVEFTTLSEESKYIYFCRAFYTLTGKGYESETVSYVKYIQDQVKRRA